MGNRRKFLQSIAAASGVAVLSKFGGLPTANIMAQQELLSSRELPTPWRSGIDHIVVVMMENRSFDHLFGWIRGADGRQALFTMIPTEFRIRHIIWRETLRVAATQTRTIRMRVGASNTTIAAWTDFCSTPKMTLMLWAFTQDQIAHFTMRWQVTIQSAIATSVLSWVQHFRIEYSATPHRLIA